ncbi:hypothetical protein pEaSNUABM11_00194 [Erwinia phage pEa_SNUABM_11]|nr:hypothetical protein pEaSNUABM11_00194 [Erwinia phage pEa_SNUABM_11]
MAAVYQVQADRAFGFNRSTRRWEAVDVSRPLNQLVSDYQTFEVGLESLEHQYTFFSQYHTADLQNRTDTLQDWLATLAGVAIPTLKDGYPTLEFAYAHYQSLFNDFEPEPHLCPPGYHYTQDFAVEDATDVVLVLPDANKEAYRENVLYNIDGQWVSHQSDSVGVRLNGAGKIVQKGHEPGIGCMVFKNIGGVRTYPLSSLTITRLDETRDYYSRLMVSLPEDLTGKTVAYVIGGILHWLPAGFYFSQRAVMLSLPNLNVMKLVHETRDYYDWDSIGVDDLSVPTSTYRILSSATLLALLKHESSFMVVIDTPWLEVDEVPLNLAGSYGRFHLRDSADVDSALPLGMLVNDYGKCVNFWPTWEEGEWTFHTQELDRPQLLATHARWRNQSIVNDARPIVTHRPFRDAQVWMRRLKARK